ncbi:transposon Tf2-9 polyprotein [Trichonephila clavipes]|nr:transposon Tf2-9 polyprotein [Trichonephila clavipes]
MTLNSGSPRANELFCPRVPKAITDTFTKFNYIVSNLPPEAAAIVRDLIITPDETDPYGAIKAQLIQRTGESSQQEIRKLLTGEELGDRKPSELLRTMNRRAASHNVRRSLCWNFSSAATDRSANYLGIHHANNRRESRRSRRQNPRKLQNEEIVLAPRNRSRNRSFSRSRESCCWYHKSFKNELRNAFHPAAIKKNESSEGVNATTFSQPHISRRLFIKDKSSNTAFLIDTGSDVSVLPASLSEKGKAVFSNCQPLIHLLSTFMVKRLLTLDLNLRRVFRWPFLIASVSVPIIGADFLYNFNISPDLRNRKLIDNATKISTNCKLVSPEVHSIKLVSGESIFHDVLREFPEIVKPPSFSQEVKHNIKHFIETSGPPVFAKARRLAPDRLKIAKSEFQHMLNLGHVRPSKSNYASPLHIVPKKILMIGGQRFIRQAAHILAPLVKFLKGIRNKKRPKRKVKIKPEEVLEWTDEATTAFELVKQA